MKHNYSLQLIARIFIAGLFLQSCAGFGNTTLSGIEGQNNQPDVQAIIGREFVAEGGHLIRFYDEAGELKANAAINAPQGFSKTYEGLSVAIEQGAELANLARLDEQAQRRRIQVQPATGHQRAKVIIYKGAGLMGGSPNEVILFCGNPGVGKSTLCNSVFGKAMFNSGISLGTGMTEEKQEYIHDNKLYIDTPGLSDVEKREKAAEEIEEALKHNNNYKIVFVAVLEEGRIRADDLVTINTVCDALKGVNFEYGLIFNKVTKKTIQKINQSGLTQEALRRYLKPLSKQPSSVIILSKDDDIEGEDNMYFQSNDENRGKLLRFLNDLKANMVEKVRVRKLDIKDFEEKMEQMEKRYQEAIREISEMRRTINTQRDRINELEDDRNKTC
jgi:GTP-binding protein EngB required for normal cell division